jgi:hypothetical protein
MGQEALVVRLNFVVFTDSVSELYGKRMYFEYITFVSGVLPFGVLRKANNVKC